MKHNRHQVRSGCVTKGPRKQPKTYAEVVALYIAEDQQRGDDDLQWFAEQPDFRKRVARAVMSRMRNDLRHPHQRRIREKVLKAALGAIDMTTLEACTQFAALHDQIEKTAGQIRGIGPLAVFDFACRIGAGCTPVVAPDEIYLHCGTMMGAMQLVNCRGRKTLRVIELPPEFRCLSARHAEDCLCIYKDELKRIHSRHRR